MGKVEDLKRRKTKKKKKRLQGKEEGALCVQGLRVKKITEFLRLLAKNGQSSHRKNFPVLCMT